MTRLLLLLAAICGVAYGCPSFVKKSVWSTIQTNCKAVRKGPADMVIIHHTDTPPCATAAACTTRMRSIHNHHTRAWKWCDIGYNWLVGNDGIIREGRGWDKVGAHAKGFNSRSIGISFIGNFHKGLPSAAAINAVKNLIRCGVQKGKIRPNYTLKGHRDVNPTTCPGNALHNNLKSWGRFKAGKQVLP